MEDRLVKGDWRIVLFGGGGGRVGDGLANMNVSLKQKKRPEGWRLSRPAFFFFGSSNFSLPATPTKRYCVATRAVPCLALLFFFAIGSLSPLLDQGGRGVMASS